MTWYLVMLGIAVAALIAIHLDRSADKREAVKRRTRLYGGEL